MGVDVAFIFVLVLVSLYLMRDVARHARCPKCEHCQQIMLVERKAKEKRRHDDYHRYRREPAGACSDADCPGRK